MTLIETIEIGMNTPECSFFVGHFTGAMFSLRLLVTLSILFFVFKLVDKLAFEPMIEKIKNWWKRR
jgi:hypothetical protein